MSKAYSAGDIVVLSGLEAIRKNPWMYVGSVSEAGAHQLLWELVYNSVDEALAGACSKISVTPGPGFCKVEDDGRGIPTELHPAEGVSACEVVLTKLHSGSKFFRDAYRFSAGLHGLGLSCVNALSERLTAEIRREGALYKQEFSRGVPKRPLKAFGKTAGRGTTITFWPDKKIFRTFKGFDGESCAQFLEELSFLNPGVEFTLAGGRGARPRSFRNRSGIAGLLARLNKEARPLFAEPLKIRLDNKTLSLNMVLQWTTDREPVIRKAVEDRRRQLLVREVYRNGTLIWQRPGPP